MGRGRAKAKQTKVARELKYRNYDTDFTELQRELHGDEHGAPAPNGTGGADGVERDDHDDPYADLVDGESGSAPQH